MIEIRCLEWCGLTYLNMKLEPRYVIEETSLYIPTKFHENILSITGAPKSVIECIEKGIVPKNMKDTDLVFRSMQPLIIDYDSKIRLWCRRQLDPHTHKISSKYIELKGTLKP
jgi:hypothetical protein